MKLNKIISSALIMLMLVSSFAFLVPTQASAAEDADISIMPEDKIITDVEAINAICNSYLMYNFDTAKEMLDYEMDPNGDGNSDDSYLDYLVKGNTGIYVNRYTGFMYYVNFKTGQILTSNPIDPAYQTKEGGSAVHLENDVMSQLMIEYFSLTDTEIKSYDSLRWILEGSQPSVSQYDGGLAVEYTLGSAKSAFIAPSVILLDKADEHIIKPMFAALSRLMQQECGDFNSATAATAKSKSSSWYIGDSSTSYNMLEDKIFRNDRYNFIYVRYALDNYAAYALAHFNNNNKAAGYVKISNFISSMKTFFSMYSVQTPALAGDVLVERIQALADGHNILLLSGADTGDAKVATYRQVEKALKVAAPSYTLDMAKEHEAECGFASAEQSSPAFKVSIVYTIDGDDLIVSVPTNLISFDETSYALSSITPLKHFGAGDMDNEGIVFYPDGSGMILNFGDFYYGSTSEETSNSVYFEAPVYGADYCYSTITGAHREQIVMPVYGVVSEVDANDLGASATRNTVNNGYFAIMEQGASMVTLGCESGGGKHKYISVFTEYAPYPTDTYDLSQTLSVNSLGSYTVVAPARSNGSLRVRYTMLVDESMLLNPEISGYPTNYVGMADRYRDYLEANGEIQLLDSSYSDLPLYIEALGSIDIIKKVLSFPVTVSTPLTEFDDVAKIYSELSNAKQTLIDKAKVLDDEANAMEAENPSLYHNEIVRNRTLAESYRKLSGEIENIKNINFRLTGFTNGGMHFTYPAKVKWESSVGGKKGFNNLLATAKEANKKEGYTFGIFPDFDFMYINNTAAFDGISNKVAACMVDNRYASKQVYSSINQEFESIFALVVSSQSFDMLYDKFIKQYSKYDVNGISVSTLGSDLNSNFDVDNPIDRESGLGYVKSLLGRMSQSYSVMSDKGNAYTLKYLDHILNAPLDSSHLNNSSYAIPFYGMVLHGYVNYAGTPINYSGSPEYETLRSIESGASLYYILCTQNTNYLKEDHLLSKYYGVDYENWFNLIVEQQTVINAAIGDLQQHRIVDHSVVLCERVLNDGDMRANRERLIDEFLTYVDETISDKIDKTIKQMREDGKLGTGLVFTVTEEQINSIMDNASDRLNLSLEEVENQFDLRERLTSIIENYQSQYASAQSNSVVVTITSDDINYKSMYKYFTDSFCTDEVYTETDYTCDNGNVVMVAYEREINGTTDRVVFLLNYNVFSVKIKINEDTHQNYEAYCDEDGYITLDSFGFIRIE